MILGTAAGAELVGTGGVQGGVHPQIQGVKGVVVPPLDTLPDLPQADALYGAHRIGKVTVDDLPADAHGLKNLGGLIGLQGGNAHFGGDFHDSVENGVVIIPDGLMGVFVQPVLFHQLRHALLGQVGVDGPGTVAKQGRKVVNVPGLRGFQDHGHRRPLLGADQILLGGGDGKQGGNRHVVFIHPPVRQNDDIGAVPVGPVHLNEEPVQGIFQGGVFVVQQADGLHPEARAVHIPDLHQLQGGEDWLANFQHPAVFRLLSQKIPVGADVDRGIRDDLLPHGIDGRVGDLGKKLLKIVKQGLMGFGQHRQWNVRTHGGDFLGAGFGHGQNGIVHILIGIPKGLIQLVPLLLGVHGHLVIGHRQLLQGHQILVQPLPKRLPVRKGGLALFVGDHLFLNGVHQQHSSGLQPGFAHNVFLRNVQHPYFGGDDEPPVLCNIVPGGPQTVPVQHGTHNIAVGKEDGGGAVPGLHHGGIIVVKIPLLPAHSRVVSPGLGNGDHHSQGQGNTVHHHKFQGVVQHGGVGAAFGDHWQDLVHVLLHAGGLHGLLPGQHSVGVSTDGVDLAVVQDQPVGVGPLPAGGGVGGKTGVDHGDGALIPVLL